MSSLQKWCAGAVAPRFAVHSLAVQTWAPVPHRFARFAYDTPPAHPDMFGEKDWNCALATLAAQNPSWNAVVTVVVVVAAVLQGFVMAQPSPEKLLNIEPVTAAALMVTRVP